MPRYDYRCTACGTQVEVMHAIDGAGPAACEVCGGAMRKALSPPVIHFRGSGWAKKDARSAASGTSAKQAGGSGTAAGADEEKGPGASSKDSASTSGGSGDKAPAAPPKASTAKQATGSASD